MKGKSWIEWILLGGSMGLFAGCGDTAHSGSDADPVAQEEAPLSPLSPPHCNDTCFRSSRTLPPGDCCTCANAGITDPSHARLVYDDPALPSTMFCRTSYEVCLKFDTTGKTLGHACTCAANGITQNGYMDNDIPLTPMTYYCRQG